MAGKQPYDLIILTMSRWDGMYSSAILSLATEIAKANRVFYIDHPYSLKDVVSERGTDSFKRRRPALLSGKNRFQTPDGFPEKFTAVTPAVTLPVNWLPKGILYNVGSAVNERIMWNCVRDIIDTYRLKNYILWNSFDPFFLLETPSDVKPVLRIYQSRDDITQESYIARHGKRLEELQLKLAGLRLATSATLAEKLTTDELVVHNLPNGANTALFAGARQKSLPKPPELQSVEGDVLVYTGNISKLRIDFDLLIYIAKKHPDKTLLLIGGLKNTDSVLFDLPNVMAIGPRPLDELPAYLACASCAIIPFLCNKLTESIYPLKLNEYLAAGLPVVSTPFSSEINSFSDHIKLESDPGAFNRAIEISIAENNEELIKKRVCKAEQNSWKVRSEQFWQLVKNQVESGHKEVIESGPWPAS